jgi:hypothetical protein
MTENTKYILQTIVIVLALIGIIYLGTSFGFFNKTKIVKISDTVITYIDTGRIITEYEKIYLKSKPNILYDTVTKDSIIIITKYAVIDTLLNSNIFVTQLDSLNKIDSSFNVSLRTHLNMKYNIDSNEVEIMINQKSDSIKYLTKYVEKSTTIEKQYWYNEPYIRYGIPVVAFVGGFYLGTQMK